MGGLIGKQRASSQRLSVDGKGTWSIISGQHQGDQQKVAGQSTNSH